MTRESAAALWNSFCEQHGGDITLEAVSDFIVVVHRAAVDRCALFLERNASCETCAGFVEAMRGMR